MSGGGPWFADLLAPLDDLLQIALESLDGFFGWGSTREHFVELLGHRARHLRVVRRNWAGPGIPERFFAQCNHRHLLPYLPVFIERVQSREGRGRECLYLLTFFAGHELNELPRLVLHLRGGADEHVPSPEAASGLAPPLAHGERRHAHLIELYLRHLRITHRRVDVGPFAAEDCVSVEEGHIRLPYGVAGYRLRRHTFRDHALLCGETRDRLGAVYDHPVAVEDFSAMGPDVLEAVAHAALVVGALEDEAVSGARVLDHLLGHLFELFPSLWGF